MFQIENSHKMRLLDTEKHQDKDFEIDATNYDDNKTYGCEYDHTGAEAALIRYSSSFDPKTAFFQTEGRVVYVCPQCDRAVMEL